MKNKNINNYRRKSGSAERRNRKVTSRNLKKENMAALNTHPAFNDVALITARLEKFIDGKPGRKIPSRDAVLLHGMFSEPERMLNLRDALMKKNIYRNIYIPTMDIEAKYIPKLLQGYVAREQLLPNIKKKISSAGLRKGFDIIGHSNGGYAALHLISELSDNYINNIITLGTPRGIWQQKPDYSKVNYVIHIFGGQDIFMKIRNTVVVAETAFNVASVATGQFGSALLKGTLDIPKAVSIGKTAGRSFISGIISREKCNPAKDAIIFRFPDEAHRSINADSMFNGVADLIAFINGTSRTDVFMDENGLLHVFPWCRHEHKGKRIYKMQNYGGEHINVCNGFHDQGMVSFPDDIIHNTYFLGDFLKIFEYPFIMSNLKKAEKESLKELKKEHALNRAFKEERKQLISEYIECCLELKERGIDYIPGETIKYLNIKNKGA